MGEETQRKKDFRYLKEVILNFECPHRDETIFIDVNSNKKLIHKKCRQVKGKKIFLCDYCKGYSDGLQKQGGGGNSSKL